MDLATMTANYVIPFENLQSADLIVDALYKSGNAGNAGDDPISKLIGVGNQGGFRPRLTYNETSYAYIALYSAMNDPDWPDDIDLVNGIFTYYGDNKTPGHLLEDTPRRGNKILALTFKLAHGTFEERRKVPPFFIFTKGIDRRDVVFRGVAVPGSTYVSQTDDIVAVWKSKNGQRFQNYKAVYTILDIPAIKRDWLNDLSNDNPLSSNAPEQWVRWVKHGKYFAMKTINTRSFRTKAEQLPSNEREVQIISEVLSFFRSDPHAFEQFAGELVRMADKNVISIDITRPTMDGGRDGVGKYRIGVQHDAIHIEFALEAKCYAIGRGVGVHEVSRLISRLRQRHFGFLVTTSYVAQQAYKEIREDQHPIVIIAARDIAQLLMEKGYGNLSDLKVYLQRFVSSK